MEKMTMMEKYPIMTQTFKKDELKYSTVDEIVEYFVNLINNHPISAMIGTFDHYNHTKSLPEYEIAENIKDAKMVVFCFGTKIPNPNMLALRPRSFGVVDTGENIVITALEAPIEMINNIMEEWVNNLKK